jgi:GNAT superfamily N-acetyltransferase
VAGGALIRELRREDCPAVAVLHLTVNPHQLETPERVWFWATRGIEREQWRHWVAEADDEIVGSAWAAFEWSVPTAGKGRFWVAVPPERRRRGIGGALYGVVEEYLREHGAWRARTQVDADPAGERFLERRGYERREADRVSELVLASAELPEPSVPVVPLAQARHLERDLYEICAAGEIDMPGDEPETALTLETWRLDDYGLPDLSADGSFVALDGGRAVALAFLCLDPERRLAYNQMTATLPTHRRRGLALAVKLASARWARENVYERLLTENDESNTGMLAINERLGYRPLYDQVSFVRQWERPPGERR